MNELFIKAPVVDLFDTSYDRDDYRLIELPDASLKYFPCFIDKSRADQFLIALKEELDWRQETIRMYGKEMLVPRLSAWYGDSNVAYTYSGIHAIATSWSSSLIAIKSLIEEVASVQINSVLANLYRDGADSVSWHADDEPELGLNPVIASVSLGEPRSFQMKHKRDKNVRSQLTLEHGSLLIMSAGMQQHWLHQIPKTKRVIGERINLTFRYVVA